ncbi:MAG: class I SAM-dependent methyltransferase [bacterium]|nr:class I SAM-dependent methyltransferase [bacterium]
MTKRFEFGQNWKKYFLNYYLQNKSVPEEAAKSLNKYWSKEKLKNKSFIDIGCGSGIFSLAAIKSNCLEVLSFDYDKDSVDCCKKCKKLYGSSENWKIEQGDILDDSYVKSLGQFDFVYAWGVLHHTGNMWKAIDNASKLVASNGELFIAIYNHAKGKKSSEYWLKVKKRFNYSSTYIKKYMIYKAFTLKAIHVLLSSIKHMKNPIKEWKSVTRQRKGMSFFFNLVDWLGGYPYEYASFESLFRFVHERGFNLTDCSISYGHGCHELVFKKSRDF